LALKQLATIIAASSRISTCCPWRITLSRSTAIKYFPRSAPAPLPFGDLGPIQHDGCFGPRESTSPMIFRLVLPLLQDSWQQTEIPWNIGNNRLDLLTVLGVFVRRDYGHRDILDELTNAQFTPPTRHDKTVLSLSRLVCRCEFGHSCERVQLCKFSVGDSLGLSGNPIHTTEADATQTKQFCRVWRGGVNQL